MKKLIAFSLCGLIILSGCSSMSKLASGSLIGGGAGAAVGAAAGALIGKDAKSAAIGAAIGTAIGAGTGAIIGNKMDKKAEELAKLENAQVETITDVNGLTAIKVTFDSGILFATNSSALNAQSQESIASFADAMKDLSETDITIYGHTDNTGSAAVNERLSQQRAEAVSAYLQKCGVVSDRIISTVGQSFNMPVASNDTAEGRAQNRRVEIYITADEAMIVAAQQAAEAQQAQ